MSKKNNSQGRTIQKMTLDSHLLHILRTKDNHKMSRYDAYLWLVEHIVEGQPYTHGSQSGVLPQYNTTNSDLAEVWHWSRPSVQKFVEELIAADIIQRRRFGNTFAYSLTASGEQLIQCTP